jgi:hypothetical protein
MTAEDGIKMKWKEVVVAHFWQPKDFLVEAEETFEEPQSKTVRLSQDFTEYDGSSSNDSDLYS